MKQKAAMLCLLFALTALPACAGPLRYSAAPIEAWVVDKETNQPLEGVIVVAHWALESTSRIIPHQTNPAGSLMILEAVTDKDGRFYFPAWGPKWHLGSGELTDSDPELILFKSDYKYLHVSNSRYLRPSKYSDVGKPSGTESKPSGSKRISFWSGERIGLEKFKGAQEEYAEHLYHLSSDMDSMLDFARGDKDCNWKKTPRMLTALHKISFYFDSQGIKLKGWRLGQHILRIDDIPRNSSCGSAKEFLQSYLQ